MGFGAVALAVAGSAVVGLLVWWLIVWSRKVAARVDNAWEQASAGAGGSFQRRAGPWYNRARRIDASVAGRDVLVDHYTVSTGKSAQVFTRLRAAVPHAGALRLRVYPKHIFSGIGKALGFQDVPTGDADFDERFVVKANDERLARAWLTASVRAAIAKAGKYGFTLKDGQLTAQYGVLESDGQRLAAAMAATAELANGGQRLVDRWSNFASEQEGSLSTEQSGTLRIAIDERKAPVRIEANIGNEERTVTRVTARVLDPEAERYAIDTEQEAIAEDLSRVSGDGLDLPAHYALASSEPEKTSRRLSRQLCGRLPALAPLRVESDGNEVAVVLPGLETDEGRLRDAMELASALAAEPGKGAYR